MNVSCPKCGTHYEIEESGKFQCSQCEHIFQAIVTNQAEKKKNTPKKSVLVQFLNGIGFFASAASVFFIFIGVSSIGSGNSGPVFFGILATLFVALILFSTAKIISLLEIIAKK